MTAITASYMSSLLVEHADLKPFEYWHIFTRIGPWLIAHRPTFECQIRHAFGSKMQCQNACELLIKPTAAGDLTYGPNSVGVGGCAGAVSGIAASTVLWIVAMTDTGGRLCSLSSRNEGGV